MNILNQKICNEKININLFKNVKNGKFPRNSMVYPFFLKINNNYNIFYRTNTIRCPPANEVYEILNINQQLQPKLLNTQIILGSASHNLFILNNNNKFFAIGGQSGGITHLNLMNKNYNLDLSNNLLIENKNKNIDSKHYTKIFSPYKQNPINFNGIQLFKYYPNNNNFQHLNNQLPILSGLHNGRNDGRFAPKKIKIKRNIKLTRNTGFSTYDSQLSLLFNPFDNHYYIYVRANLNDMVRYIQYAKSKNLINWSPYQLINIDSIKDHYLFNLYIPNFFKLDGINQFIGIIPIHNRKSRYSTDNNKGKIEGELWHFHLLISKDAVNWIDLGNIISFPYHVVWIVTAAPIIIKNYFYFYFINYYSGHYQVFRMEKNRFTFIKFLETKNVIFKNINFVDKILIDVIIGSKGFLEAELLDENQKIIDGFSFSNFQKIYKKNGIIELKWKNTNLFPNNIKFLSIVASKTKIFSINGKIVN